MCGLARLLWCKSTHRGHACLHGMCLQANVVLCSYLGLGINALLRAHVFVGDFCLEAIGVYTDGLKR